MKLHPLRLPIAIAATAAALAATAQPAGNAFNDPFLLRGCVNSREQALALEQAVGLVDDVMGVINQLSWPGRPAPAGAR
ncbi:BON domain-containing protein [Ramlibacter tataouinensis]|nr:BON domain-containing protein [Ramlibacter tataouinensis]